MAQISKYINLDKNVLLEYIYNDGNLISEPYNILVNSKTRKNSYVAAETSASGNVEVNQLFQVDPVQLRYGKVNPDFYSFLQLKNYPSPAPIRHDSIRIHLPINWTFGEFLGFYLRVYTFDVDGRETYELSNFYFDMTDVSQQYLMNFTSPPLLFKEKLWGKNITIDIPAASQISSQRLQGKPIPDSINANLTNGNGLNITAPIFIEFHFIRGIQNINNVTTYLLQAPVQVSTPQTPEFERLGLRIENSQNGDFFEIFGTYNGTIAEFNQFIADSRTIGKRYYVQYNLTVYEQNIRGKTTTFMVMDNFNEKIEYRPIIKYSTTTAIIDVEMRLVDAVDDSSIIRRASYGMLQDEVSKYSLKLMKINLANAAKPKIYNIKNAINPDLVGVANSMGMIPIQTNPKTRRVQQQIQKVIEKVEVPFPVLIDRFNVISRSDNSVLNAQNYFGFGKMEILLYPFDNIVGFTVARNKEGQPDYFDLSQFSDIRFVIKSDDKEVSFPIYKESGENDLAFGRIAFKITQGKYSEIKKIYKQVNTFYITGKNLNTNSVIYTGLFRPYDDLNNVADLNQTSGQPDIILDETPERQIVVATRRPANLNLGELSSSPLAKPTNLKNIAQSIDFIKGKKK
jgi:hypothetical protein